MEKTILVRTYHRDNANPYPGRLVREEWMTVADLAHRGCVGRAAARMNESERLHREADAERFEDLADRVCCETEGVG